ncbi:uncharacterized protein LOC126405266 [Epinephelus moara]|uniref:uncharacterized protein LOC126405266 n=1 Tax=Epinephelus moara TaxID=300413 RepID=UPI00214F071D|nr:uncharacterized protein LOC126405266 [Epinephelus moara]
MQGGKAPGIDCLTVEFYKAFWDIFAHDMLQVFNESLAHGSLPVSCRRAIITLLPKKGNLQEIKNWRPVSLLCTDYKIPAHWVFNSLHWLLEEPLTNGARLDVCRDTTPGLREALCQKNLITLKQLIVSVGPALANAQAVASALEVRSIWLAQRILELWRQKLSAKEKSLLQRYSEGRVEPDPTDDFPEIHLTPDLTELSGPLLTNCTSNKSSQTYEEERRPHGVPHCESTVFFCGGVSTADPAPFFDSSMVKPGDDIITLHRGSLAPQQQSLSQQCLPTL